MMPGLGLLGVALRERLGFRSMKRLPRAVDRIPQARLHQALRGGGSVNGRAAAGYLYHSIQITNTVRGCAHVLDIGCGSGEQLLQVAALNPETHFTGVDLCPRMLDLAAANASRRSISNVDFLQADLRAMNEVASASIDGALCTMTLHLLDDFTDVMRCFQEISRVLKPRGALYVEDFGRLKSHRSLRYFLERDDGNRRDAFAELYEASMRSAFRADELRSAARDALPTEVRFHCTFPVPFLVVLKTPDRGLTAFQRYRTGQMLAGLGARRRRDYAQLACAFRLGGLATPELHAQASRREPPPTASA